MGAQEVFANEGAERRRCAEIKDTFDPAPWHKKLEGSLNSLQKGITLAIKVEKQNREKKVKERAKAEADQLKKAQKEAKAAEKASQKGNKTKEQEPKTMKALRTKIEECDKEKAKLVKEGDDAAKACVELTVEQENLKQYLEKLQELLTHKKKGRDDFRLLQKQLEEIKTSRHRQVRSRVQQELGINEQDKSLPLKPLSDKQASTNSAGSPTPSSPKRGGRASPTSDSNSLKRAGNRGKGQVLEKEGAASITRSLPSAQQQNDMEVAASLQPAQAAAQVSEAET